MNAIFQDFIAQSHCQFLNCPIAVFIKKLIRRRAVFRTLQNIYDGAFCENRLNKNRLKGLKYTSAKKKQSANKHVENKGKRNLDVK